MNANLFPDPETSSPAGQAPSLQAVADPTARLLELLAVTLGIDTLGRHVTALEQDGKDPDDATYTIQLDTGDRITLGPIATLMSRPKIQQTLLVRLGISPAAMKASEWQDTLATIIAGATTHVETSEAITARAREWATEYLEREPPTSDRNTACLDRNPYIDDAGAVHLTIAKLAKFVARTSTEQINERKLAAALRDAGWAQQTLMYYPDGEDQAGKPKGRRSSVSYYKLEG